MQRFEGKVALVTGATTGIGRATAVRLASEGALVAVNQLPDGDPSATLREIREAGGTGFPVVADMSVPEQVVAMVREVVQRGGRLDHLVSNAGINPMLAWDETTLEQWDLICNTNLRGPWIVATESAKQMIAGGHGGSIVFVSSISAHVGAPFQTAYCATKGGISMLAKALGSVLGSLWNPGQLRRTGCGGDADERPDDGRPEDPRVLHRAHRPAPHRSAGRARCRHHLPAQRRGQLRHECGSARRRRVHRQRRALRRPTQSGVVHHRLQIGE